MKMLPTLFAFAFLLGIFSCHKPPVTMPDDDEQLLVSYENELFSIALPKQWNYDDSEWNGLSSLHNEIDIYNPDNDALWIHIVKTFMPFKWKGIDEAKEFAKTARAISGDDAELFYEMDSLEIGGYPTSILFFANYVDNDTIIQKQFVTYMEDSHILMYFNQIFPIKFWDIAQDYGDFLFSTIKLNRVENPLENKDILLDAINEAMENGDVDEKYIEQAEEVLKQFSQNSYTSVDIEEDNSISARLI